VLGPGVYITFFDPGESAGRALPPFGPLLDVVVRPKRLIAERKNHDIPDDPALSIARWLEAQLEYQRATGEEVGGRKRSRMRVTAADGLFLRFVTFGAPAQSTPLRELGPYAVVLVGENEVEGDGVVVAVRKPGDLTSWELTPKAGTDIAGARQADIGFRSRSTSHHPGLDVRTQAPPQVQRPAALATKKSVPVSDLAPPLEELERARLARERLDRVRLEHERIERERLDGIARAKIEQEQIEADRVARQLRERARLEQERADELARKRREEAEQQPRAPGATMSSTPLTSRVAGRPTALRSTAGEIEYAPEPLLWRLRFFLGGLLLLSVVLYAVTLVRGGFSLPSPGGATIRTVGVGETVTGGHWDVVLNNVARTTSSGTATAQGVFVIVRVALTNKGAEGSEPSPGGFTIVDSNGKQYTAQSTGSEAYTSQTAFTWPASYPPGRPVTTPLVFDVDPAAKGLQLVIFDAPQARIRLG
jgi:hypothetical protein